MHTEAARALLLAVIFSLWYFDILMSVISVGGQRADLVATDQKMCACICIEMGENVAVAHAKSCKMCFFNSSFARFRRFFFLFWHPNLIANVRRARNSRQNVAKKNVFSSVFHVVFFLFGVRALSRSCEWRTGQMFVCLIFSFLFFVVRVCIAIFLSTRFSKRNEKIAHTISMKLCRFIGIVRLVSRRLDERQKKEWK